MPLANYVVGLVGVEEAMRFAVSVQEAERQEKFNNSFNARHKNRTYSDSDKSRHAVGSHTASQAG
jgi:hypothetical protein